MKKKILNQYYAGLNELAAGFNYVLIVGWSLLSELSFLLKGINSWDYLLNYVSPLYVFDVWGINNDDSTFNWPYGIL